MTIHRRDLLLAGGGAAAALAVASNAAAQQPAQQPAGTPSPAATDLSAYDRLTNERRINVINLHEIEKEAEKVLPPEAFAFIAGGSGDEWTLRNNLAAFDEWVIEPDYLAGTPRAPDVRTTLLGEALSLPVITAPMGGHRRAHARGELPAIEGTNAFGTLYTSTTVSSLPLEEIAAAGSGPKWYQVYFSQDPGFAREELQRVVDAGYTGLVVTVDSTTFSNRERPLKLGIPTPDLGRGNVPLSPDIDRVASMVLKADLDWDDVAFCAEVTGLPVLVKGVLTPGLAAECVRRGCAGVWVSNHGGRGIDRLAPAIAALPRIADAVRGDVPIVVDSGFRRGQDVFMALALGASAVALGRPVLYGSTLGGSLGVQAVYQRLRAELQMVMQLSGAPDIASIKREHITRLRDL